MLVAFHSRAEYVHTLSAGLLAVDPHGCILAANAQARYLLQGLPATRGRHFDDVFRAWLCDVVAAARDGARIRTEDRVGSVYAARLENAPARVRKISRPTRLGPPPNFVAEDPFVADIVAQVAGAAQRRIPILIRGATGTGKGFAARSHPRDTRSKFRKYQRDRSLSRDLAEYRLPSADRALRRDRGRRQRYLSMALSSRMLPGHAQWWCIEGSRLMGAGDVGLQARGRQAHMAFAEASRD